jgi:hypothetical protein
VKLEESTGNVERIREVHWGWGCATMKCGLCSCCAGKVGQCLRACGIRSVCERSISAKSALHCQELLQDPQVPRQAI